MNPFGPSSTGMKGTAINKGSEDPSNRGLANTFPGVVGDESAQLRMIATKPFQADC